MSEWKPVCGINGAIWYAGQAGSADLDPDSPLFFLVAVPCFDF